MIKIATVGTSAITENFIAALSLSGRFEHAAVYSRDRERGELFARNHGVGRVFTDLSEMAGSGIDAVYIASPNRFHAEQSELFLRRGVHVLCEKPIVSSAGQYVRLKELADSLGLIYAEAIIPMYTDAYGAVHRALAETGKTAVARIDYCQRSSRLDSFLSGGRHNIFDMSLHAGTLNDLGVYCVWCAVDLFGMPDSVEARASFFSNGADKAGCAVFSYPEHIAVLTYSKDGQSAAGSEIIGENGTLKIAMVSQYAGVELVRCDSTELICGYPEKAVLMRGEADAFADFIEKPEICAERYEKISECCLSVHCCMDMIRTSAGIKYPTSYND